MADPAQSRVSYADYLAQEAGSERKHEWFDGQVLAMAGGKPVCALLAGRVIAALHVLVDSQQQRVEWYTRGTDGAWVYRSAGPGQVAEIDDGVTLEIDTLYDRTDIPAWDLPPLMLGEGDTEWADRRA